MKKINKIFLIFAVIILSILFIFTNEVSAVGNVSQTWVNYDSTTGERYLLYRTFTSPSNELILRYTNDYEGEGFENNEIIDSDLYTYRVPDGDGGYLDDLAPSKWVYQSAVYENYEQYQLVFPGWGAHFKTIGIFFHVSPICTYEDRAPITEQQANSNPSGTTTAYATTNGEVTEDLMSIEYAVNDTTATYVYADNVDQSDSPRFSNAQIHEIMSVNCVIEDIDWGTGLLTTHAMTSNPEKETLYRLAMIAIYKDGKFSQNVVINDNIIKEDDINILVEKLNGEQQCYVSNILISQTLNYNDYYPEYPNKYGTGRYPLEVAKSSKNIFTKADNKYEPNAVGSGYLWTSATKGLQDNSNALGSMLNLFDNILTFPQLTQRKVIVRHINIGDNTTISTDIINNATRLNGGDKTLILDNPDATITSVIVPEGIDAQEYYTAINVNQGVTKNPLIDANTYKCIGYNVQVANSYDEAMSSLNAKIRAGKYDEYVSNGVYVAGNNSSTAADDYVIIDFYYSEYDETVYVNHVYVDKNGVVLDIEDQTIIANESATMGDLTIDNLSTKKYIEEKYIKKLGSDIITNIAESLVDSINQEDKVFYQGYEVFDTVKDISELIGNQVYIPANNKSQQVRITGDILQVNYYYVIDEQQIAAAPKLTIGGNVFAMLTGDSKVEGVCTDTQTGLAINSIPSGTNLKVGITGIPKGMIGAITTEYVSPMTNLNTVTINLNIILGNNQNKISYDDIPYSVGYYKITDMLVYKASKATIYDAGSSEVSTVGESLFSSWKNHKIIAGLNDVDLNLELVGINGKIDNTKANIDDINNYIRVYLRDKYGNVSSYIDSDGNINMNYINNSKITQSEYKVLLEQTDIQNIAEILGLVLVVEVQNMTIKLDGQTINDSNSKIVTSVRLSEYLNSNGTIQATTSQPSIQQDKYKAIGNVTSANYNNTNLINNEKLNGISTIAGKIEYFPEIIIGDRTQTTVIDNVYYSTKNTDVKTIVFEADNKSITKTYEVNNEANNATDKYKEVAVLNVYTPITVTTSFESETSAIVNQVENVNLNINTIQTNTPFTITFDNAKPVSMYSINSTKQYNAGYYIRFGFDVYQVKLNEKSYKNGEKIEANTWIGPIYRDKNDKASITAQIYGDLEEGENIYTARSVAYNITDLMRTVSLEYSTINDMLTYSEMLSEIMNNICDKASYFSETTEQVNVVNRLYDFRITDLKDISWKSVFRISSGSATNVHTGKLYYSGTTKWNTSSEKLNEITTRTSSEVGRNPLRILPIGPYKNADITYINAPKLGYRFSFDLKLTGAYTKNNKVEIATKFYYVSKDGKTFLEEYVGGSEGIYLFYKTDEGKYVRIDENTGGGYNLTLVPNDAYRYIEDSDKSTLSTSALSLGNLRNITLNYKMATVSNTDSYVTYYGEYKLPNSTIAVKVNKDGTYDINTQLKDGYIGVIFDITAHTGNIIVDGSSQEVVLSYLKNTDGTNTSQWDYEGFLGYTKYGNEVPDNTLSLKLEKGKWNIDNYTYNRIKGSVILYDMDQRAAEDYD